MLLPVLFLDGIRYTWGVGGHWVSGSVPASAFLRLVGQEAWQESGKLRISV